MEREGKGWEGKGREEKGWEGKGREGKGRKRKGWEGKGRKWTNHSEVHSIGNTEKIRNIVLA